MDDQTQAVCVDEPSRCQHILSELRHIRTQLHEVTERLMKIEAEEFRKVWVEIATLKVKSGIWGVLGGLIPISAVFAIEYIKKIP